MTFGFWPHLLDLTHDHHHPINWGDILVDVLPGHRQRLATHWAKLRHRDGLFARLDLCNELRNRIAHHEPIWKLGALLREARARPGTPLPVVAPAPQTPVDALARLTLLYGRVVELLGWLSPPTAAQYTTSEMHLRCINLLHPDALDAYRHALPPAEVNLATEKGWRTFRKALHYASRRRQPVLIKDGHRLIGYLNCSLI